MHAAPLAALLLLAACTAAPPPDPAPPPGLPPGAELPGDAAVAGVVLAVDLSPMMVDADGLVTVRTDAGELLVRVPARMNLCRAEGLAIVGDLEPGDRVEAVGAQGADGSVTPCLGDAHRLTRTAASPGPDVIPGVPPTSGTYRGVYVSGFETSAFYPCDRPGEVWWLEPDAAFQARYAEAVAPHAGGETRGTRYAVEVVVVGDVETGGAHGPLRTYGGQIAVRETREAAFLDRDFDDAPSCR